MITWICVVKVQTGSRDLVLLYFVEIRRDGVDMFHDKMRMIESFERKICTDYKVGDVRLGGIPQNTWKEIIETTLGPQ